MKTLKTVIATLIAVAVVIPLAGLAIIYSGVYNVAATNEHPPLIERLLDAAVHNSVAERAEAVKVPTLDREKVLAGAANYKTMCAGCHGAPGVDQGLPGVAMYPQPPRLDEVAAHLTPAQVFWVVKHGIQATGMPAWGPSHSDDQLWSLVAFVQQLPKMSAAEYQRFQQLAAAAGMGHHAEGGAGHGRHHRTPRDKAAPQAREPHVEPEAAHGSGGHSHGGHGHGH